jgi:hypothetical protein
MLVGSISLAALAAAAFLSLVCWDLRRTRRRATLRSVPAREAQPDDLSGDDTLDQRLKWVQAAPRFRTVVRPRPARVGASAAPTLSQNGRTSYVYLAWDGAPVQVVALPAGDPLLHSVMDAWVNYGTRRN